MQQEMRPYKILQRRKNGNNATTYHFGLASHAQPCGGPVYLQASDLGPRSVHRQDSIWIRL